LKSLPPNGERKWLKPLRYKSVLIVSGEVSGDQHGAKLVSEVLKIEPDIHFFGIGGEKMRQAGVKILFDNKPLSVVGVTEILSHALPIFRAWQIIQQAIKEQRPDLIVLIDYPGFNLRLARTAKNKSIPVLYYISPQIWAWKRHRVRLIKECVNKMLVVFPFEAEIYRKENVPVEFVGHPLSGTVHPNMTQQQAREHFHINNDVRIIGLLPGSRKKEIQRLLPLLLESAKHLKAQFPDLAFILPVASPLTRKDIDPYIENYHLPIHIIQGHFYDALQLCDAAIVSSGTATLETALMGIPMVIVYKTSPITYFLAKRVIKIPHIGLCNIVAGRQIVVELIQNEANFINVTDEISHILNDPIYRREMHQELLKIKALLGKGGGATQAARALIAML
jgi:lipid-A-disaccharide synthase